jgi:hypothetical protein
MRAAIILLFVLTAVLASAIVALYARNGQPESRAAAEHIARDGEQSAASDAPSTVSGEEVNDLRAQFAEQSRRLDRLERGLSDLRGSLQREPVEVVETPEHASDEEFRRKHEQTILAILAEDRDRLAFDARMQTLRGLLETFSKNQKLPRDTQAKIETVLIEGEQRHEAVMSRLVPGGKYPKSDDPVMAELLPAEQELYEWRKAELMKWLDFVQVEDLTRLLNQFGGSRF